MQTETSLICRSLVVKIASRCNINCSYCYMYNMGDDSWQQQPKKMSREVVLALAERVKEHCSAHQLKEFGFVLHGGEPLLAGQEFIRYFVEKMRHTLEPEIQPYFMLQTNGILLDPAWCRLMIELDIQVGISLDGPREIHDMHRVDHQGRGTYDATLNGIRTVQQFAGQMKLGILSVANLQARPESLYDHIASLGIRGWDVLIPEHTYDDPPPGSGSDTPCGDWYIALFEKWMAEAESTRLNIRLFDYITGNILGHNENADALGNGNNELLVIETDGGIESVDVLKACGQEFTKAGASVFSHSFDQALQTPLARLYNLSHQLLPRKCLACPVNDICGGGYIPHRYSSRNGFNNPSVYCNDLLKLITHIHARIIGQIPEEIRISAGLETMTYEEASQIIEEEMKLLPEPDYAGELEAFQR